MACRPLQRGIYIVPEQLGNAPTAPAGAAAAGTQAGQAEEHRSKGQLVPTRLFHLYQ